MRERYGKVFSTIWYNESFLDLALFTKVVYFYLLSCDFCNSCGFFFIETALLLTKFNCQPHQGINQPIDKEIDFALQELVDNKFISYKRTKYGYWFLITDYLRWNKLTNSKHAKGVLSEFLKTLDMKPPKDLSISWVGQNIHSFKGILIEEKEYKVSPVDFLKSCLPKEIFGSKYDIERCLTGDYLLVLKDINNKEDKPLPNDRK